MAVNTNTPFLLSAADVSWGRRECTHVDFSGVAPAALDGNYFEINAPTAAGVGDSEFYVWFDLDAASADPAPAGKTGIEVSVSTGDTEAVMATALTAAVESHLLFRGASDSTDTSLSVLESDYIGTVTPSVDVDSTLAFTQSVSGVGGNLGSTQGGVAISMESTTVEITSDQTGAIPLDEVMTGQTVEVSMSLLEMTPARWKTVVGSVTGDSFTPSGGTEIVGYGESRLYQSLFELGGELVLHPTRYPSTDRSRNITLWKSSPKPASVNFSGEDPQLMEITFKALADRRIESAIRLLAFGDNEQDVRE